MIYKYYFKNSIDCIEREVLRRESYNNFINEVKELNQQYNYSIYIFGSFLGYLIEKTEYNDIDFIIMSQKILEVNELTQFFISFHELCKKYNIGYNLMYTTDKNSDDFNDNIYSGTIFKTGSSRVIRLYESIETNNGLMSSKFVPLIGSDLFEGVIQSGVVNGKTIKKMQMGIKFFYPIKIQ